MNLHRLPALIPALLQLALATMVVYWYQIENEAFLKIFILATVGFAVHAILPLTWRLPFFTLLSMGGALLVFSPIDTLWLLGSGTVLIGLANLPIPGRARALLLVSVGAVLAIARAGMIPSPWSSAVWPILASMFMFRLVLYVMAASTDTPDRRPWWSLAYFFMLPNLVFPLFPVVDYQTFRRTYYDRDEGDIYQIGLLWIARGLVQLLIYRYVYQHLIGDAESIVTLGDLWLFMLATLLLYLHISGQFHLIVGMLHLFGFRLPETHKLYLLASSFPELLRRINIYWTDFVTKTVFLPVFLRVRHRGPRAALVISAVIVFVTSWLLHSYQWFWLRGRFPLAPQDAAFWAIIGTLVLFGGLRELNATKSRTVAGQPGWDWKRGVLTAITFCSLCVLWSLWSTESLTLWLWMLGAAGNIDVKGVWLVGATVLTIAVLGARDWKTVTSPARPGSMRVVFSPLMRTLAPLLFLLVLAQPAAQAAMPVSVAGVIQAMQSTGLNARDLSAQHRGYYEQLDIRAQPALSGVEGLDAPAGDGGPGSGERWQSLDQLGILRERQDLMLSDLAPSRHAMWNGREFSTNRWGMRDRDYAREKPANTLRIALLGPSHVMGNNVADGLDFATVVEDRMNANFSYGTYRRFEILNFGVDGFSLPQQLAILDQHALAFSPDVVIVTQFLDNREMTRDFLVSVGALGLAVKDPQLEKMLAGAGLREMDTGGLPIPYAVARRAAERLGVPARMPYGESRSRASRIADAALTHSFSVFAKEMRASGIAAAVLALNTVVDEDPPVPLRDVIDRLNLKVFDLFDVYGTADRDSLRVAPWDDHPNSEGHRLIAARFYDEVTAFIASGAIERAGKLKTAE
jgi:hypothetical protein